jgi:predicted DsbA family dithiol-disulfide isomerase
MRVDIWSDVVCPWCYVGKARFEKALRSFAHRDDVEVVYHSFELDPSYPRDKRGETNLQMLSTKFGMAPAQARQAEGQVAGLARAQGLGFDSERPIGNTFDLHRVLHLGLAEGVQQGLLDAINEAYFAKARPVFDHEVITEVAAGAGLDPAAVGEVLDGEGYADEVRKDEAQARQLGISGVPFFVFDMALGVSGAQPTELFTKALNQAWNAEPDNTGPDNTGPDNTGPENVESGNTGPDNTESENAESGNRA